MTFRKVVKHVPGLKGENREFSNIVQELRMEDTAGFKEMLRMEYDTFLKLLSLIEPFISPQESYHGVDRKSGISLSKISHKQGFSSYKSISFSISSSFHLLLLLLLDAAIL